MFRFLVIFLIAGLAGLPPAARCADSDATPAKTEAWIDRLSTIAPGERDTIGQFRNLVRTEPALAYTVFHEGIARIRDAAVRAEMLRCYLEDGTVDNGIAPLSYTPNPRLLDVMETILAGPAMTRDNVAAVGLPYDKTEALDQVRGIAFQEIGGREEFERWRKSVAGQQLTDVMRDGALRVVEEISRVDPAANQKTLDLLCRIRYYRDTSVTFMNGFVSRSHPAAGLMQLRRDLLHQAGLLEALAKRMREDNDEPVRQAAVLVLAFYGPDAAQLTAFDRDVKRELPRLIADEDGRQAWKRARPDGLVALEELLAACPSDWATDLIARRLADGQRHFALLSAIQSADNPRLIPALISLLDVLGDPEALSAVENSLRRLTQAPWDPAFGPDRGRGGLWWRAWWHDNRTHFPPDVQKAPSPRLTVAQPLTASVPFVPPAHSRLERACVSEDPRRYYWLVSPRTLPERDETAQAAVAVMAKGHPIRNGANPVGPPGLIVALQDGNPADASLLDSWLDASDTLRGRFLIAVMARQDWAGTAPDGGSSPANRPPAPSAVADRARFAEQIARQLLLNNRIDPARVYLCAIGPAGIASYWCALQRETPFQGFIILSGPLRTSLLPALSTAKGRRFFLGLGLRNYRSGDVLASAAEPMLRRNGAMVHAERIAGSVTEAVRTAIRWLEREPK